MSSKSNSEKRLKRSAVSLSDRVSVSPSDLLQRRLGRRTLHTPSNAPFRLLRHPQSQPKNLAEARMIRTHASRIQLSRCTRYACYRTQCSTRALGLVDRTGHGRMPG